MINAGRKTATSRSYYCERVNAIRNQTSAKRDAMARENNEKLERQKEERALVKQILTESPQHQMGYTQIRIDRWVAAELARA